MRQTWSMKTSTSAGMSSRRSLSGVSCSGTIESRWKRSERNCPLSISRATFCELDEMMRTSIGTATVPPTRLNLFSTSVRSSACCAAAGSAATSER